jgi:hypothetical protein
MVNKRFDGFNRSILLQRLNGWSPYRDLMDSNTCASEKRQGAIQNLEEALEVEDVTKKDFHVRQALQMLALEEKGEDGE